MTGGILVDIMAIQKLRCWRYVCNVKDRFLTKFVERAYLYSQFVVNIF